MCGGGWVCVGGGEFCFCYLMILHYIMRVSGQPFPRLGGVGCMKSDFLIFSLKQQKHTQAYHHLSVHAVLGTTTHFSFSFHAHQTGAGDGRDIHTQRRAEQRSVQKKSNPRKK